MPIRPALCLLLLTLGLALGARATEPSWTIVERRGGTLVENGRPFRFLGLNAPTLLQNEGRLRPDHSNRFPDAFEISDSLASLRCVGARVTRCFAPSVSAPEDQNLPVYITGVHTYNEEALRTLDRVLATCREFDVRVIIPLIDGHSYPGWRGINAFAAFRGKRGREFWTDDALKADFRHWVATLVLRRNTVSGVLYRDDPAILAWQLGQELDLHAPDNRLDWEEFSVRRLTAWSREMAAYLKSIDPKHLVMEGGGSRVEFLDDANIDILSTHITEHWNRVLGRPTELAPLILEDGARTAGKKPLVIDDFGLAQPENLARLMAAIRTSDIAGGLLWCLRPHHRDGGFYDWHEDGTPYWAYHVPGFSTGRGFGEADTLATLRAEAYQLRQEPLPVIPAPRGVPLLMSVDGGPRLTWRGTAGAQFYQLQRADSLDGPWETRPERLEDSRRSEAGSPPASQAAPPILFIDTETQPGGRYHYRIRGVNETGATPWSAPVSARG